jgi:hypothetical protein
MTQDMKHGGRDVGEGRWERFKLLSFWGLNVQRILYPKPAITMCNDNEAGG